MALILQIETATTSCSIALAMDGQALAFKEVDQRNIHAEVITLYIEQVLAEAKVTYAGLDAIAVSAGPGSYTGLRIGISTAKGLCYALDKPLISVDTLAAMASGVSQVKNVQNNVLLCPMIDARRMEVYTAVFSKAGEMIKPTAAEIIDENSFSEILKDRQILFFGDGADKCKVVLGKSENAIFLDSFANSAVHLSEIAAIKFQNSDFVDVAYFEPYYLKDFIAGVKKA